jgi:F-type H+-transporting ATPase subunit epsilon
MADALQFDLVSPERLLMSSTVQQVVVPGSEGEMTVLVNHAPVMTTLKPGLLIITGDDGQTEEIFVRGGFADINAGGLTILAEMAVPMGELTSEALAEEIRLAEEELQEAGDHLARQSAAQKKIGDLDSFKRWKMPA